MPTLTPDQQQAIREAARAELAKRDLYEFVKQAWHVLEPHTEFCDGPHVRVVCRWLQDVTEGKRQRVVINIPPGMTKTMLTSVMWPCWEWISSPHLRYNFFSYAQELSTDASRLRRALLTSQWYRSRWPHVRLAPDNNQATQFSSTVSPGSMIAGSVGGIATGRGGERLVIDDPMNPRMAHSDLERESTERWLRQTLPSRLRSESGAVVIIMQRTHERDPSALALEFGFDHLCLPWHYEPDHPNVSPDDWRTEPGEPLAPMRFSEAYMAQLKKQMDAYSWAGQYQQRPSPLGGGIWKPEQHIKPILSENGVIIADGHRFQVGALHRFNVCDMAYSASKMADWTSIIHFGGDTATGKLVVLGVTRFRVDALGTADAAEHRYYIKQARERTHASYTVVEDGFFASRIIERMREEGEPVKNVKADKNKVARAMDALPVAENGNLYADKQADWWETLSAELKRFRGGDEKNDQADCLAYGCLHWRDILMPDSANVGFMGYDMDDHY